MVTENLDVRLVFLFAGPVSVFSSFSASISNPSNSDRRLPLRTFFSDVMETLSIRIRGECNF